jgi:hypothetical protein
LSKDENNQEDKRHAEGEKIPGGLLWNRRLAKPVSPEQDARCDAGENPPKPDRKLAFKAELTLLKEEGSIFK